jgi:hypothetical protein
MKINLRAARIKPEAEEPGKISNREPRQTRENYSPSKNFDANFTN